MVGIPPYRHTADTVIQNPSLEQGGVLGKDPGLFDRVLF